MLIGNLSKALDLLQKGEKAHLMENATLAAANCVQEIGRIKYMQKEYSAAKAHITKAKEKFYAVGNVGHLPVNACYLAWVEFREGNSQEAKKILKEAKEWVTEGNGYWQAVYARSLGEFAFHEGDKESAAAFSLKHKKNSKLWASLPRRQTKRSLKRIRKDGDGFVVAATDGADRVDRDGK
jgi:tetratricopeptide (TPR) repeat protein